MRDAALRSIAGFLLVAAACRSETIPVTHGTALSGKDVVLPRDFPTKLAIVVVGFTQKSASESSDWGKGIGPVLCGKQGVTCFQIPVLESVPKLFRGLIVRAMKKGVPEATQPFFVPIFEQEKEWKAAVSYRELDDAYVLVVGQRGEVLWKTHGAFTEQRLRELKDGVAKASAS